MHQCEERRAGRTVEHWEEASSGESDAASSASCVDSAFLKVTFSRLSSPSSSLELKGDFFAQSSHMSLK